MTNEIQKQYDRLEDVPSIMLRMKDVYAERLRPPRQKARVPDAGRGRRARERPSQPLLAPEVLLLLPRRERAKGRLGVLSGRRQMMCACIANKRALEESVHNSSPTQVLERSRKLSKDEMILRLGDGKAVAAEAVGSLRLVDKEVGRLKESRNRQFGSPTNLRVLSEGKDDQEALCWTKRDRQRSVGLVHTDVCGPLSIPARGGFSYFITFTDDHSRYGYVYLMRYKSEAFGRFKEYRLEVENQTNRKIKALRSDRGGEYLSGEFIDYLKENGILSQWTPPGRHNSMEWLKGGTEPCWTWFGP
ncbi:UNVERIFIED_CONTAM: hypothetical protein Slati_0907500 [Sesamum latifolium]|uniref:Integrase catalytic domain-containing protein n=1 Tax=Sesamum latifolium TaxID=2727402 RepID=A0AAW2XNH3_9LAMI